MKFPVIVTMVVPVVLASILAPATGCASSKRQASPEAQPGLEYTGLDGSKIRRFEYSQPHMGVECRITIFHWDESVADAGAAAAFARVAELNRVLSDYLPDSEVNQWLSNDPSQHIMSDDLRETIEHSLAIARMTGGAFDITIGPLTKLWREARANDAWPGAIEVQQARALVGWRRLERSERGYAFHPATGNEGIDFGGIGKGLAAQEAAEALIERDCRYSLVDLGGDIVANYPPPDREGWRVQLDSGYEGAPPRIVTIALQAAATSGASEQFMMHEGRRYSHIIDPRTGYPIADAPSVSVIAPDGAAADALASAISVLGEERWQRIADRFEDVEVIFHEQQGAVERSEAHQWSAVHLCSRQ